MAKSTKAVEQPSAKIAKIIALCARPEGATSEEIMRATKANKRRSKYSLSRLAERFNYRYGQERYEDDPLLHHLFLPIAARKTAGKKAAPKKAASSKG